MKFDFEIPDETIKEWIESASTDYVYTRAKQIVEIAIDRHLEWSEKVRFELYEEIKESVARRLGVPK